MRALGIDVPADLVARWAEWFAPHWQPFLVDDELAAVVGGTERELSDEVRDTFCLYGPPDGLRHVWLAEERFLALPRELRSRLVRAQRTHEREVVPSVRAWEPVVGERVRRQADGHRFVWWPCTRPGGRDDVAGTVLVWRSPDGLVQHAAVTLGGGWALHKPSQGWMSPTKVLTVDECKASSRAVARRLERRTIVRGV